MSNLFDLSDRVAVITGSTRGIGKAIAQCMADHGAKVVVSSRKADACTAVASEIRATGGQAIAIPCNISRKQELEQLVEGTRKEWGRIDILVENAAVNPFYGSSLDIPDSAFEKVMQVNIQANTWLCSLVIPEMRERKDGSIIIVSSVGGISGSTTIGAYCISKAADMQIARNLAVEFGPDNIRVNCIAPGLVKTEFARALWDDERTRKASEREAALGRIAEPEEMAGAVVYLASAASSFVTGQTLVLDGGRLL